MTARAVPERTVDDDQAARTRTSQECRAKAAELNAGAAGAPEGPMRDSFLGMAEDWRRLAEAESALMNLWS